MLLFACSFSCPGQSLLRFRFIIWRQTGKPRDSIVPKRGVCLFRNQAQRIWVRNTPGFTTFFIFVQVFKKASLFPNGINILVEGTTKRRSLRRLKDCPVLPPSFYAWREWGCEKIHWLIQVIHQPIVNLGLRPRIPYPEPYTLNKHLGLQIVRPGQSSKSPVDGLQRTHYWILRICTHVKVRPWMAVLMNATL